MESTDKHISKEEIHKNAAVKHTVQVLLVILAIAFVYYGAYRGEADTVFTKAIRLCLECVGIG